MLDQVLANYNLLLRVKPPNAKVDYPFNIVEEVKDKKYVLPKKIVKLITNKKGGSNTVLVYL